jgi:integrase
MSIYKRGEYYWIKFYAPDGRAIQRSAGTKNKQEAQELHDKLKHEAWQTKNLGVKPKHSWQEAIVRYCQEHEDKKSLETDMYHFRWLDQHLSGVMLCEITRTTLDDIKSKKKAGGATNSTVNRVLATVKKVLNVARVEWGWIDSVPPVKMLTEPAGRIRWLKHDEAIALIKELPEHLAEMARFTLATGLRERNVTGLKWEQVDLQRRCAWIHPDQAKGKKAISVPLNDDALAVLRRQRGKHTENVFTYEGNPIHTANTKAWRKALVRAGIEDFRWHDLRHTWASWHVQNGTPLNVLKELGGWADLSMVMRYAHLSSDHLHGYAKNTSMVENAANGYNLATLTKFRKL